MRDANHDSLKTEVMSPDNVMLENAKRKRVKKTVLKVETGPRVACP